MRKNYSILLIAFLIAILGFNTVFAQNDILPPQRVSVITGADNNGTFADLQWYPASGGIQPAGYIIFVAYGQTQDPNQFKQFEKVQYIADVKEYHKKLYLSSGVYTFFIKAYYFANNQIILSSPSNYVFAAIKDDNPDKMYIRIVSQPVDYVAPGQDYSYQIKAETNLPDGCPLIYQLISAPDGMTIDQNTGLIKWAPTGNGEYAVAIQVGTACKIAVNFAYQKFILRVGENDNQPYIKITSKPSPIGYVGKTYIYQVEALSNIRCPIRYQIKVQPTEYVKFNPETGLLEILVDKPVVIGGMIKAFLECDTNVIAIQQFSIRFGDDQPDDFCAKITGQAAFEDGSIVNEGQVRAMCLTDRNDKYPVYFGKIQQGFFSIPVPEGIYILEFDGMGFQQEWYENAADINTASKLDIKCGDALQLNVTLTPKPEPKRYVVSGRVTAEEDGSGVLAMVEFIPLENKQMNMQAFVTKTGADGYYKIELPDIFTYRAHAIPIDKMHMDQWFDKVQTPMEADLIVLENDVQNIDFVLQKITQQELYGFTGRVVNLTGEPVKSMVQAIPFNQPNMSMKNRSFVAYTDDAGYYTFNNLPAGKYVALSIPADRKYVPGYYKTGEIATLKWKEATIIEVSDVMIDMIFEIKHRERTGFKGIIGLNGNVIASGTTLKNSDNPLSGGIPLPGAFVYALDEYGQVSDFAFTDANGHFELNEVPEGSSTLYADMVGFSEYRKDYSGDYSKSFNSSMDIELELDAAAGIDDLINLSLSAFPQPANDFVWLNLNGFQNDNLNISIYDNTGMIVSQFVINVSGDNTRISLNNLSSGIFSVLVSDGKIVKRALINVIK